MCTSIEYDRARKRHSETKRRNKELLFELKVLRLELQKVKNDLISAEAIARWLIDIQKEEERAKQQQ